MNRRSFILRTTAAAAATGVPELRANPTQPLRIMIPYSAGGTTDQLARALTDSMSATLKQAVICENRPGAAGLIATNSVLSSQGADGSQLLLANHGVVSLPLTSLNAKYDPQKDFKPVAHLCVNTSTLMVGTNVPATNLQQFLTWAKAQPEGIVAANAGIGSAGHILTMLFAKRAGLKVMHIPYRGSADTANALLSNQVHMQLTTPTSALIDQVKLGKVRMLAVSSLEPSPLVPGVPPIASAVKGFTSPAWFGMLANAAVPDARIEQYSVAIGKALKEPGVSELYASIFMEPRYMPATGFKTVLEGSVEFWRKTVSELDIQKS